jgi:hypothetical protein
MWAKASSPELETLFEQDLACTESDLRTTAQAHRDFLLYTRFWSYHYKMHVTIISHDELAFLTWVLLMAESGQTFDTRADAAEEYSRNALEPGHKWYNRYVALLSRGLLARNVFELERQESTPAPAIEPVAEPGSAAVAAPAVALAPRPPRITAKQNAVVEA